MGLVSLAVIYNYWVVILRIAFSEIRGESGFLYISDFISDLVYLCDIGVQMRTGFMMDGIPMYEPLKIRQHYMNQQLFIRDVISIFPTEALASVIPSDSIVNFQEGAARLNRLLKLHTLYRFYDLADSRTSNPNGIRAVKLTLSLATVIHWIGCLYYITSEYEGLGLNNWVYTNDTEKQRFVRKYVVCLYWSAMTLTTIGDCSPPETDLEFIFTGLTFLIGVFVFATVVGNVGDVIANMNATRQEFQSKMDQIKLYLTHRKVPPSLQMKVKKWAEYSWSRTQATDEYRLLHMLPERLRAEIAVHVHLDTLCKVKIFEHCEREFLCELVLKLRSQIYSPRDFICRAGETGREMYIINHGKVEVVVANPVTGEEVIVARLSEGNYFGEISLLRLEGVPNKRTADVRSIGYSELLCLSRKDLMTALVEYPEAKSVLEEQARERIKNNLQAKRTFSVDNFVAIPQEENYDADKGYGFSELRTLIETLKKTQVSQENELQTKCQTLTAELIQKDCQLREASLRIQQLERLHSPSYMPLISRSNSNIFFPSTILPGNSFVAADGTTYVPGEVTTFSPTYLEPIKEGTPALAVIKPSETIASTKPNDIIKVPDLITTTEPDVVNPSPPPESRSRLNSRHLSLASFKNPSLLALSSREASDEEDRSVNCSSRSRSEASDQESEDAF